jgi:hypothetical protein
MTRVAYIDNIMFVCFIVFKTTFSNNSAISWRPVLVVEETAVPGENHRQWESSAPFLLLIKPGANPRRIGDMLIGVAR